MVAALSPRLPPLRLALIAAANFALALLGGLYALAPGYVMPLWPPAGFALAMCLIHGRGVWPAIWGGAFAFNLFTAWRIAAISGDAGPLALPAAFATGSVLQMLAGAWLVRRFCGDPPRLERESEVLRFMLFGGPLACVIAPGIALVALKLGGSVGGESDLLALTGLWWFGDSLGVLLFAPLTLAWFAQPAADWRARRRAITLPLALALVLVAILFQRAEGWERERIATELQRRGETLLYALDHGMRAYLGQLHALASFVASQPELDAERFRIFTDGALAQLHGIRSLSWSECFAGAALERYEAEARREFPDYRVFEPGPDDRRVAAPLRDEYCVVRYVAPLEANRAVLGHDFAANPDRRRLLERVRDTGEAGATGRLTLVQARALEATAVLVYLPVYRGTGAAPPATLEARRAQLRGIVAGVFGFGDVIASLLPAELTQQLAWRIVDASEPGAEALLYAAGEAAATGRAGVDLPAWQADFDMAGRTWRLEVRFADADAGVALARSGSAWTILFGVLLLSALLGALLFGIGSRTTWVERRVAERTAALSDANRRLRHEIAERQRTQAELRHVAHHDALTELPNRRRFLERLQAAVEGARRGDQRFAVLFIDLDRFKHVNDSLGHAAGDELLRETAGRLRAQLRVEDLLARLGGDEFVVLARLGRDGDAEAIAAKLLAALARPFLLRGHAFYLSASIGISLFPLDGTEPQTLLRNADTAMYRAKERGRGNAQFYTEALTRAATERVRLENELHQALRRGEFALHYQPQLELATGRIHGYEALLRWNHPELGVLAPERFLRAAEDSGLIVPIGDWVVEAACRQLAAWRRAGYATRVAVNVAASQIARPREGQPGFVDVVLVALAHEALPVECLELEITESLLLDDSEPTHRALSALHTAGVHLTIDDFGTGYSSLGYLKRLPLRGLKIDRGFVRNLLDDPADAAIARASLEMARGLGMRVTAEGVETREQLDWLHAHGCDFAQGWLIGRPQPPEALELPLAETRPHDGFV